MTSNMGGYKPVKAGKRTNTRNRAVVPSRHAAFSVGAGTTNKSVRSADSVLKAQASRSSASGGSASTFSGKTSTQQS